VDLGDHISPTMKYFYQGCQESLTKYLEDRVVNGRINIDLDNFEITPILIHRLIYSFVDYACREHNGLNGFDKVKKGLLSADERTFFSTLGQMLILGDSRICVDNLIEQSYQEQNPNY
jgi:hypothetical protein